MISNLQTIPANNQFIVVQSIWHSEIYMNIYSQTGKIWKCTLFRSLNFLKTPYYHDELAASVDTLHQLNADQKGFLIKWPRRNQKFFFIRKILAYVRQKRGVALAVAGSGITAQLLTGGRPAHSAFKSPLDPHETSTCNVGSRSFDAALLKRTNIIVWDEAPMTHRFQYEALARTI
ncbi:Helitron helicase [Phytophthora megakarya]|uniref:ATP-dependent DNA helicase n=1 Tax=Phytophthora megakarya TaxID=4795 RepID=A0A225VQ12_9STRA|nr:Helitron helicase [Phytophthora megakarya]